MNQAATSAAAVADPVCSGGAQPPNPQYVALAWELVTGQRFSNPVLSDPSMLRIVAVWRGEGSYEERTLATMAAAEKEGAGLWVTITGSLAAMIDYHDFMIRDHARQVGEAIASTESEDLRRRLIKSAADDRLAYLHEEYLALAKDEF